MKQRFVLPGLALAVLTLLASPCACAPQRSSETPEPATLRFAVYGDTRDGHDAHQDIVDGVLGYAPALVLQTGDLVHHGDDADEWAKFDQITSDLRRSTPFYPTRGNHDLGSRGYFEARVSPSIPSGNRLYYSFDKGDVHFVALDTEEPLLPGSPEYAWLDADLARAQAAGRFIVPFFHTAIFSIGPHSAEPETLALRPILHPLFRKYGVTLVFQGHDHIYYRTRQDGITYVVTGGGGAPLYDAIAAPGPGDVYEKVHHFCIADVGPNRVTVTVYRRDLSQLDQFELPLALHP